MKKYVFIAIALASLIGCTNSDDFIFNDKQKVYSEYASKNITHNEALDIASKVLKRSHSTRAKSINTPVFEYILNSSKTRASGASIPDTLAYIINYPNNGGFVIVSSDKRVYPVLAFSDKGNFNVNNEIAKYNFVDNIYTYIANADTSKIYNVSDSDFDGCYSVQPSVKACINQGSPWNKYVEKEHKGCPVGCVAVATALALSYSTPQLTYHNTTFYFKSILEVINKNANDNDYTTIDNLYQDWENINQPSYTYEQAVDSTAKLLYWIGKDVGMTYTTESSSASSYNAYILCNNLVGNIDSGYADFDITEVVCYLNNNYIVYLRGRDYSEDVGHAWISDGCYFCVKGGINSKPSLSLGNQVTNVITKENVIDGSAFIHCDWGWGGNSNGYYSGAVFNAQGYNFKPSNFFAIKRTK